MPPANLPILGGQQTAWVPAAAEFILESLSRLEIRGRQITPEIMVEARRSANFLLSDWVNRGVSLWLVGDPDVALSLLPGEAHYDLPIDTADLLDCYLRTFTPAATSTNIGNALTPVTDFSGVPVVMQPYGDVLTQAVNSQTLSSVAGSQILNLYWPSHGLAANYPIFWGCPVSIGGLVLPTFSVVSTVVDSNNVTIMAPRVALETSTNQGATPLFATTAGSSTINAYLPAHGCQVGSTFTVSIPTAVGGLTLDGEYTVLSVTPNNLGPASYQFTFAAPVPAITTDAQFENGGQLNVTLQAPGAPPTNIFLWPISRDDHAMLPITNEPGNPTSYWFNRTNPPSIRLWPAGPPPSSTTGPYLGFIGYRMRDVQVFNPGSGQTPDVPRRAYPALVAALTAALAEKYKASSFQEKIALAEMAWQRFSDADREKVNLRVVPDMGPYWR